MEVIYILIAFCFDDAYPQYTQRNIYYDNEDRRYDIGQQEPAGHLINASHLWHIRQIWRGIRWLKVALRIYEDDNDI